MSKNEDIPRACEHCHKDIPFGKFELVRKATGAERGSFWSVKYETHAMISERYLCAQCGYNIVNLRVVKHYEVPERVDRPDGTSIIRTRDILSPSRPYLECILITQIMPTTEAALVADKDRYFEQIAALEAQRRARRAKRYEWKLRQIGQTVGDAAKGIEPLTEDEIEAEMKKFLYGSSGSGSPRSQVREIVTGGVKARGQRESSTSTKVAVSAPQGVLRTTAAPRRAR